MQRPQSRPGQRLGQVAQYLGPDAAPAYRASDVDFIDEAVHPREFHRPAKAEDDVADGRTGRTDQVGHAMWATLQQGGKRGAPGGVVLHDPRLVVKRRDEGNKPLQVVGAGQCECGHNVASLSVSRSKNRSGSISCRTVALGARPVTPHQSITVMPRVRSDCVSTVTLTCREAKRSGRKSQAMVQGSCRGPPSAP